MLHAPWNDAPLLVDLLAFVGNLRLASQRELAIVHVCGCGCGSYHCLGEGVTNFNSNFSFQNSAQFRIVMMRTDDALP